MVMIHKQLIIYKNLQKFKEKIDKRLNKSSNNALINAENLLNKDTRKAYKFLNLKINHHLINLNLRMIKAQKRNYLKHMHHLLSKQLIKNYNFLKTWIIK